ncbi:MAG: Vitamin B12 transporter BtuB [Pseudomonadales bacterium]|nr:Vitamin B12 transporter BtuB [Pseudomonadales bacterium]
MIGSSTRARLLAIAISAATAALAARHASAQEGAGGLEEIIVTAERVEASLQETPIALSVFDAGTLDALGVIESGDIAAYTPNLRMDKTPASLNAYAIGIRGVASAEPSLAVDPTVGIYVDGVYLGRSSAAAFEVVDLERIEVLRGPQGTLYGRNTTGGAVNVVTAKPRREFGFTQELTAGERELLRTATSLDTGAFGDFAATLSFIHGERGGLARSSITGGDLGQYDQQAWRAALRWTPSDTVTADYVYDHYQQDSNTNLSQISHVRPLHVMLGGPHYEQVAAAAAPRRRGQLPYAEDGKDQTLEIDGHALTVSVDLGAAMLKSISSWREFDNRYGGQAFGDFLTDGSDVLGPDFDGSLVPAGSMVPAFVSSGFNEHEQWSQEFQFVGRLFDERFGYNAGVYYFHEEGRQRDPQRFAFPALFAFGELDADTQAYLCAGECYGKSVVLTTAPDYEYATDNDAWAVYGQFDYRLSERLTAILGLRWSVDDKATTLHNLFNDVGLATLAADDSWNHFNPSFTLTYDWSDTLMVYAKYASGYRAGGFNIRAATTSAFETPADEETVESWEIGGKSEWFDNRLRLNAAIFYYEYDDRQVSQFEAGSAGASSRIVNAGASEATGVEIDLTAAPTESLLLTLAYGYVDIDYTRFVTSVNDPVTGFPVFDDEGEALVADIADVASTTTGGPENSASMIVQYTFPRCSFGTVVAQVDASYAGERTFAPQLNLYDASDSYTLWNARLTLQEIPVSRGELSVALWGRNLGNEEVREFGIDFGALGYATNTYRELRSVGADLRYVY